MKCTRKYTLDLNIAVEDGVAYTMRVTTTNAVGEGTSNVIVLPVAHVDGKGVVAGAETGKLPLGSHVYVVSKAGTLGPAVVARGTVAVEG